MKVISKIDHLMADLANLKTTLSVDSSTDAKRFNDLLTASKATDYPMANEEIEVTFSESAKLENRIPSWVDPDYHYDPQNPRKPNMRELMEAMSGKNVEDLYAETDENWRKTSHQTREILYGVIGSNEDTRDWLSIMNSSNILAEAQKQTGAMYEPQVAIQSNFNDKGILTEQIAVIKDNKGNILTSLSSNITTAKEKLLNFGVSKDSIPTKIEDQIDPEKFDDSLLTLLKNFDSGTMSIEQMVVQSTSEVIANKLSQDIPLDELAKL
jgi:hypothetical protein